MTTVCQHCQKPIVGRTDKKYCSDNCRKEAHRARHDIEMRVVRDTNAILLNNRKILCSLCRGGTITVERRTLIALGVDLSTFTSLYVTGTKRIYYFSYDYAFSPFIENDKHKAVIVSRIENLSAFDPWSPH